MSFNGILRKSRSFDATKPIFPFSFFYCVQVEDKWTNGDPVICDVPASEELELYITVELY